VKLSQHIMISLLALLTVRANAQSNSTGVEIAAAKSESNGEEDNWGATSAKGTKKPSAAEAQPIPAGETGEAVPATSAPIESEQAPVEEEDFDETIETKPAPLKKALPKKIIPKAAASEGTALPPTTPAPTVPNAVTAPAATNAPVAAPAAAPSVSPQQAPQTPKALLGDPAVEAIPTPAVKAPVVKNPVKPVAPNQAPAAPTNGAAQQLVPKQVPAGVPLAPNTAVNPSNAAAVGNPMLPAKDIPSPYSSDELKGDPNTSTSASRAKAKVKPADVGLSTDQTSAILEIRKAAQNVVEKRLTEELKLAKQDLNASMIDATPAEDVRKKFDLVQKKYLDLQRIKFERTLKIREVLSVEQRKKLQGLKTSH
jgi:ribonuclease E